MRKNQRMPTHEDRGPRRHTGGQVSVRLKVIAQMPDEQLGSAKDAADFRANRPKQAAYIAGLKTFAIINHPLPR